MTAFTARSVRTEDIRRKGLLQLLKPLTPICPKRERDFPLPMTEQYSAIFLKKEADTLPGEREMSILVKLLDSAERLVIQCHPMVEFATERMNSAFGKT